MVAGLLVVPAASRVYNPEMDQDTPGARFVDMVDAAAVQSPPTVGAGACVQQASSVLACAWQHGARGRLVGLLTGGLAGA
jgi:hypothetical protein